MDTPEERTKGELLFLRSVLARRSEKEQIELLETYVRSVILRQCSALAESAALRAELERTKARLAAAGRRNEAAIAAYRVSVDRIMIELRAQCEDRLQQVKDELAQARRTVSAREEERDHLLETVVNDIGSLPPFPLLSAETPECRALVPTSMEIGSGRSRPSRLNLERRAVFRDDEQACLAIRALLRLVGLERLWSEFGPNTEAQVLHPDGSNLSWSQRVLFLAACDLWNGQGGLAFVEILERLRGEPARALFTLAAATSVSPTAVDQWITECGGEPLAVRC